MKRIGIDARLIQQTGVGVYIRNLLHYLDTADTEIEYYVYAYSEDFKYIPDKERITKRHAPYRWHSTAEQTMFLKTLYKDNLDVMHFTYFSFPYFYKKPFVITIHDLTPLLFKTGRATTLPSPLFHIKHVAYKKVLLQGMRNSSYVIVPSEAVRSDILSSFGNMYSHKIVVTNEGIDFELQKMDEDTSILRSIRLFLDNSPFYIYVGNSYPHKNVENLLKAYATASIPEKLLLVGPKDFFSHNISQLISRLGLTSKILQLFNISQAQKIALFKNAKALVQPSLSEGFGLPVVEAQYFGCPVIASNIPVFNEIVHEHTPRFDPYNSTSIRDALTEASNKKLTIPKLDTKRFSFANMTKKTQHIYAECINKLP